MNATKAIDPMNFFLQQQLQKLRQEWEGLNEVAPPAPIFTWEDWREALLDLTDEAGHELLIRGALSAVVKMAQFKPPHLVLQELLTLTISASDPTSSQALEDGEG